MIKKIALSLIVIAIAFASVSAQAKKAPVKKNVKVKAPTKCMIVVNGEMKKQVTLNEALAWCDSMPLIVKGDNGVKYKLKSFDINVIQKEPFLNQDYGTGQGGIPILAHRAIEKTKEGDSVFLKNVIYVDDKNQDKKLPNIVFSITGQ